MILLLGPPPLASLHVAGRLAVPSGTTSDWDLACLRHRYDAGAESPGAEASPGTESSSKSGALSPSALQ
jgi:hypothetical protein